MSNQDIYLKFTDQEIAQSLFLQTGVWLETTDIHGSVCFIDAPNYMTDTIGKIYDLPVEPTNELVEAVALDGWHVNMRGDLPKELEPFAIQVNSPYRTWG